MSVFDHELAHLDGTPALLEELRGRPALFVNVASRCGLTPQYSGLEHLHEQLEDRPFTVVGFPCNQFMGQEPGSPAEIAQFCSTTYGVTFPLSEKLEVNGAGRHPLYAELTSVPDAGGYRGDIRWNFEKFVITADGSVVARFDPRTPPDHPSVRQAIDSVLTG